MADDQHDERPEEQRPAGIVCPNCAVKMLVTTTRASAPGLKVRFVWCPQCELTGRTEERLVRTFPAG